jgi:hypothetical protein
MRTIEPCDLDMTPLAGAEKTSCRLLEQPELMKKDQNNGYRAYEADQQ